MKTILFDTNVLLDVFLDRQPHVEAATRVWVAVERKVVRGYVAAHAVATIYYLAARHRDRSFARGIIADVVSVFEVAAVDGRTVTHALNLPFPDLEDAITAAAAEQSGSQAIVSRDLRGFRSSPIPAMLPAEAVELLVGR